MTGPDPAVERAGLPAAVRGATAAVQAALVAAGVDWAQTGPAAFTTTLPGSHRLATAVSLLVGGHTLSVNAFVARRPEENAAEVYAWLLGRNARLPGVAFALDRLGDVYLVARLPLAAVSEAEVDRLLGAVLTAADESFDRILELGFASAIRREWAWRRARGEPAGNLAAFAHLLGTPGGAAG